MRLQLTCERVQSGSWGNSYQDDTLENNTAVLTTCRKSCIPGTQTLYMLGRLSQDHEIEVQAVYRIHKSARHARPILQAPTSTFSQQHAVLGQHDGHPL